MVNAAFTSKTFENFLIFGNDFVATVASIESDIYFFNFFFIFTFDIYCNTLFFDIYS